MGGSGGAFGSVYPPTLNMDQKSALAVGVKLKEINTRDIAYQNCTVLHADSVGLVFEVQRTVAEGGNVETVVSQVLVPWVNIQYVLLMEERT
jgi:hypothetical protein